MKKKLINYLLYCYFLFYAGSLVAQSSKVLENRRKNLLKEISYSNTLLEKNEESKKLTYQDLLTLESKIGKREELILNTTSEINLIEEAIENRQEELVRLEKQLERLKQEYAEMMRLAMKNRSAYDKLMFVFASNSFNQAYKRIKYFQQYAENRKKQVEKIEKVKKEIQNGLSALGELKEQKQELVKAKAKEKQKLDQEKQIKEKLVNELKNKEKELKSEILAKSEDAKKLNQLIAEAIYLEVKKAREEAERKERIQREKELAAQKEAAERERLQEQKTGIATVKKENVNVKPTTIEDPLTKAFVQKKGKLNWPVATGIITGTFGEKAHPVLRGIKIQNNGIDITTNLSEVNSVFQGEVSAIIVIPGAGKSIIIRHGDYLSVYYYLNDIYVKKGEKLVAQQLIGTIYGQEKEKNQIHLEIWHQRSRLDPIIWLQK